MIVKKIIVLATFYISLFSLPAQAMNDLSIPLGLTPDKWDKYIENGCLAPHQYAHWVDQVKIFSHNTLLQAILLDPILNEPSTAILAAQLDELPANEIATRYENYKKVFDSFISLLIIKQYALNLLKKHPQSILATFSTSPITCFRDAEKCMIVAAKWLDAIRDSGEENYLGKCKLTPNVPPITPTVFWQSTLEKEVLLKLSNHYYDATTHLNATSMAILRHQLRKGFPNLEYKKHTAYTGPAICRVKVEGEESCDWNYDNFIKALELKATESSAPLELQNTDQDENFDTEILWQ